MNKHNTRTDDYLKRRKHLEQLSDEQLKERFWMLADKATKPLIDLAYTHTWGKRCRTCCLSLRKIETYRNPRSGVGINE